MQPGVPNHDILWNTPEVRCVTVPDPSFKRWHRRLGSAGFTAGHTGHVPRASANKGPPQIDFVHANVYGMRLCVALPCEITKG